VEAAVSALQEGFQRFSTFMDEMGRSERNLGDMKNPVEREVAELRDSVGNIRIDLERLTSSERGLQRQVVEVREMVGRVQANVSQNSAATSSFQRDIHDLKSSINQPRVGPSSTRQRNPDPPPQMRSPPSSQRSPSRGRLFELNQKEPLDGIIAYLTTKYGNNVHDAGIVDITASSIEGNEPTEHHPKFVADFKDGPHFGTRSQENPWLCFNFKSMRIIPTHYTIVTDHNDSGWRARYTTSWVCEVSEDGHNWVVIDERRNIAELDGPDRTLTLPVSTSVSCQYMRIRSLLAGWTCLEMKCFEIFGKLIESA
jgi:hypothetical protein